MGEVRYAALVQTFPEEAAKLHKQLEESTLTRYKAYKNMTEPIACLPNGTIRWFFDIGFALRCTNLQRRW